ncbi:MAG: hypothetical protein V1885_02880 [Candidatus Brennerbacteria bacterium]
MKYQPFFPIVFAIVFAVAFLAGNLPALAASFDLPDIQCPTGISCVSDNNIGIEANPAAYIARVYQIALAIAGVLAVGIIVVGSLFYTFAGGSTTRQQEGKDMITSAMWGIVLLFGSYLILNTVNPRITQRFGEIAGPERIQLGGIEKEGVSADQLIPGENQTLPITDEELQNASTTRAREFAYCTTLVPAPSPAQLRACIIRASCTNCAELNGVFPMQPGKCRWGGEPSNCIVNPKTNSALARLNTTISGASGIKVADAGLFGRDIVMKWRIIEAYPPTASFESAGHYNGCSVDVTVIIDNRRYLSGTDCQYLAQFTSAADAAGFAVTNGYQQCNGARYEAGAGHLHLSAKSCP